MNNQTKDPSRQPLTRAEIKRRDALRRLIAATERLLARGHTFSEISIGQLAREAGIARSTFYVHFKDRSALLREMAAIVVADTEDATIPLFGLGAKATLDSLRIAMVDIIAVFGQHQLLMRPILAGVAQDPLVQAAYEQAVNRVATSLEVFILNRRPEGGTRELYPRETAIALVRMVERTATADTTMRATPEQRERIAHTLAHVAWHAVFKD